MLWGSVSLSVVSSGLFACLLGLGFVCLFVVFAKLERIIPASLGNSLLVLR